MSSSLGILARRFSSLCAPKCVATKPFGIGTTCIPRTTTNLLMSSLTGSRNVGVQHYPPAAPQFSTTLRFKSTTSNEDNDDKNKNDNNDTNIENDGWVEFQKSIRVKGFDTGQQIVKTGRAFVSGQKRRGGQRARAQREKVLAERAAELGDTKLLGGGHYAAQRYAQPETERLLREAYVGLPPRDGPRGTRRLQRQKNRHRVKRNYAQRRKREMIRAHYARNEKRRVKYETMRQVQADAVNTRERERAYQQAVLTRYASMMEDEASVAVSKGDVVDN